MTTAADRHESWLPVVGFEGLYSVSDLGRIRSDERPVQRGWASVNLPSQLMAGSLDAYGYVQVTLSREGQRTTRKLHVLIAEAFLGDRPPGMDVAHANGVRTDNRLENLRYCTRAENCADKLIHGTHLRGEKAFSAKLTENQVIAIRQDGRSQTAISKEYHISQQTVSEIKLRKRWRWL